MVQFSVQGTWLRRQNVSAIIKSDLQLIALDIQGVGFEVFDPEIASAKNIDENNAFHLFCAGNIGSNAINKFLDEHICGQYCRMLGIAVNQDNEVQSSWPVHSTPRADGL